MQIIGAGRALLDVRGTVKPHLWFVLTDPTRDASKVVAVMLVSTKPHTDKTVTIKVGEHPFVVHDSNIDYGTADYFLVRKIQASLANGGYKLMADMSGPLLTKVRVGLLQSPRTIHVIADYCRPLFTKP